MLSKSKFIVVAIILSMILLSACNLPNRQVSQVSPVIPPTIVSPTAVPPQPTPTSVALCYNPYFPSQMGDSWDYSGSNSATGAYNRTDTISASNAQVFNVSTTVSDITYGVNYGCSSAGLIASDPVTQYAGALLSGSNAPVTVKLTSNSGITLPAKINPGDTWQQTADFDASSQDLNVSGRFVFDYTAVGFESVTVPAGTYNALRVDATIRIEVSAFRVLAGTYTTSSWMVQDVGVVKSEGTSHVSGIDFSDGMQLTKFTSVP